MGCIAGNFSIRTGKLNVSEALFPSIKAANLGLLERFVYFCPRLTKTIMALSKNRIKYIHSLEQKKHRKAEGVFLAEGPKLINDLLGKFACPLLVATAEWLSAHPHPDSEEIIEATEEDFRRHMTTEEQKDVVWKAEEDGLSFLNYIYGSGNYRELIDTVEQEWLDWYKDEYAYISACDTVDYKIYDEMRAEV